MKKIWTVKVSVMNGTVTMHTDISSYTEEAVAKQVADVLTKRNAGCTNFEVVIEMEETWLYESADEVPVLINEKQLEENKSDNN